MSSNALSFAGCVVVGDINDVTCAHTSRLVLLLDDCGLRDYVRSPTRANADHQLDVFITQPDQIDQPAPESIHQSSETTHSSWRKAMPARPCTDVVGEACPSFPVCATRQSNSQNCPCVARRSLFGCNSRNSYLINLIK